MRSISGMMSVANGAVDGIYDWAVASRDLLAAFVLLFVQAFSAESPLPIARGFADAGETCVYEGNGG